MICNNCNREIGSAPVCPYCNTISFKESLPHHLPAGSVIGGKYVIQGVLGEGGFGITYLGWHSFLERYVAVKEYFPHGFSYRNTAGSYDVYISASSSSEFFEHGKKRFLDEAKTLVRFNAEPGVVSAIDFIEENNTAYLIMEYLEGVTLQQYLKLHGALSADEAFSLLTPVMQTLEKIHEAGVIHRDISPDNIMRQYDGQLKLMDFGAAREFVDDNRSMSVMLKKGYAPEEQYRRNGKQGPWTDVYALCATIYRCITGKAPDESLDRLVEDDLQKPSALGADISPALEEVLLYGLTVRQKDRCQSMTELLALIQQAQSPDPLKTAYAGEETFIPDRTQVADTQPVFPYAQTVKPEEKSAPPPAFETSYPPRKAAESASFNWHDPKEEAESETDEEESENRVMVSADRPVFMNAQQPTYYSMPNKKKKKKQSGRIKKARNGLIVCALAVLVVLIVVFKSVVDNNTKWIHITSAAAGELHTVGVKENGKVIATGNNNNRQCEVKSWTDIKAVAAGSSHTAGLKNDGTVVATGSSESGQCRVENWTDITAIAAGANHTVGLRKDGTVVAAGNGISVGSWTDITAIAAGGDLVAGLKKDGTVVVSGNNSVSQDDVSGWSDIVAVDVGSDHIVGVKKNGTVVAAGDNENGKCDVSDWTDITAISAGAHHTVGLKSDGTVVAVGKNSNGQCSVKNWQDIVSVSAGSRHTVGVKKNGTVIGVGANTGKMCEFDT